MEVVSLVERRIIGRAEWGAQYGRGTYVGHRLPWREVVWHTEAGAIRPQDWERLAAFDHDALHAAVREVGKMRAIERFHAVDRGWQGFGYSFYIAYDGTIFEGRGWGYSGAHTESRNSTAAGVCFEGHGDLEDLTVEQVQSARWLVAEGVRLGHLVPDPIQSGHRDYSLKGKTCPGNRVYPLIPFLPAPSDIGELSMADVDAIMERLDKIERDISTVKRTMATKPTAFRDPSDGKVYVVDVNGRKRHLPNSGNKPVALLTFLGKLQPNGKGNVHSISAEHLAMIPEVD